MLSACPAKRAEAGVTDTLVLQPPQDTVAPSVFLTVTSATRTQQALEDAVRTVVLPALRAAEIGRATGPFVGVVQLWIDLNRRDLDHYGFDVDAGLAALAAAVGGKVAPVPGRHGMQAWMLYRPHTQKPVDVQQTYMMLPGKDYAPLFSLGALHYSLVPPAWEDQPTVTVFLQPRRRLEGDWVQRCETALQAAGATLADDLQIQLGRTGDSRAQVPEVYVQMAPG